MPMRSGFSSTICQMASSISRNRGSRFRRSGRGRSNGMSKTPLTRPGPRAHHGDAIGQIDRLVDLMRDEQHGLARLAPDLQQLGLHVLARLRVERGERLVHQQHHRIRRQRPGQVDALLHAAGQLRRIVPLEAGEADQLDEMLGPLAHRRAVEPLLHLHAVADVAGDGAPRQQARVLEDDGAIDAGAVDPRAVDGHRADVVAAAGRRRC